MLDVQVCNGLGKHIQKDDARRKDTLHTRLQCSIIHVIPIANIITTASSALQSAIAKPSVKHTSDKGSM